MILFRWLLALLVLVLPAQAAQELIGVLFMSPAAESTGKPLDPVLLASPRAGNPGQFELLDAAGVAVKAKSDPDAVGRWIVEFSAVPGKQFLRDGEKFRVWNAAGDELKLDALAVEVAPANGRVVLKDDEAKVIVVPGDPKIFVPDLPGLDVPAVPDAPSAPAGPESLISKAKSLAALGSAAESARDLLRAWLDDPETINRALESVLSAGSGWALLKDLDLEVKMIDTTSGEPTLGLAYSLKKSFNPGEWKVAKNGAIEGLEYAFTTEGNIAFDSDLNPSDFLRSELSMDWFRSTGGIASIRPEDKQQAIKDFNLLGDQLVKAKNAAESDVGRKIMAAYQARCSTMYYWEAGINAALESDQDFVEKNYTLGAQFGFNVSDGRPDSAWSRFNLFDHPAALLRLLTGYEESFTPRGNALPWILLGFDHVEPDGNDPRALAGDTSDYWRARAELAYRSPIARFDGVEYYLGASWRGYYEVNASRAVKSADADHPDRFVLTLASAKGLFLSYSSGKLPFDDQDSDVFELGWKLNL